MEPFEPIETDRPVEKRPVLLTVIGILTFVNLGINALGVVLSLQHGRFSASDMSDLTEPNLEQAKVMRDQGMYWFADQMEKVVETQIDGNNAFGLQQFFLAAIVGLGIAGVVLMFKRKRLGFHLYIISCILRVTSFYAISPAADVPGMIIGYYSFTSILFIFLYARCLSWANQ